MVRDDVVAAKLTRASGRLNDAERLLDRPLDAFLDDIEGRDLAAFYLFLCIQECIDIASHWAADEGWGPPADASGSFDVLADHHVIDRDLAVAMRAAAGLRNRIAHGYALIDHGRLHEESKHGIDALRRFLAAVGDVLGM